jgi:two-component system, sensor histidine kinase and response regulator
MTNTSGRLLIVDDIPQNIKVLGALLRKEGFEIEVALSGQEAIEWTLEKEFDLILLDIMMPEMDGYETCRFIKDNPKTAHIPVIFLTAKYNSDSIIKGFEAGAVDYVTKPFASEELMARVKTHIDLKLRTQELEALNKSKDKFFSIIAHDLVNPFHSLLGLSEILSHNYHQYSDEERLVIIKSIHEGAENGYKLLSDLLDWSRQNLRKSSLKIESFNLQAAALEVINSVKFPAELKNIRLTVDASTQIMVLADLEVTKIILRNLTSNAIKFTPNGGSVQITAHSLANQATINVTDTGIGIKADIIPLLFSLEKSFTHRGTNGEVGTGLGLVLCHDFVKALGGHIWIESEPGKGSTFSFTLPTP